MSQDTNINIMSTEKAAFYIGLSPATLEAWRCRGGGPIFIKLGKAVRYRQNDLDEFLNRHARLSTSQITSTVSSLLGGKRT
jgi:hypothetical protein